MNGCKKTCTNPMIRPSHSQGSLSVIKRIASLLLWIGLWSNLNAQQSKGAELIISKMLELEQSKDPKCYATASRLEDFMYGTPLTDEARNFKIALQKESVFYLRKTAAEELNGLQNQNINLETLGPIIASISD